MPPASSPIAGTRNGRALKPLIDHGLQNHRVVGDPAAAARDSNGLAGILPRTSLASSASTAEETSAIVEQRNLCLSLNINGFTGVSLYIKRCRKPGATYLGTKSRNFAVTDRLKMVTAPDYRPDAPPYWVARMFRIGGAERKVSRNGSVRESESASRVIVSALSLHCTRATSGWVAASAAVA
jgi:hypothetical protein